MLNNEEILKAELGEFYNQDYIEFFKDDDINSEYYLEADAMKVFSIKNYDIRESIVKELILPKLEKIMLDSQIIINHQYFTNLHRSNSHIASVTNTGERKNANDCTMAKCTMKGVNKPIWNGISDPKGVTISDLPFCFGLHFDSGGLYLKLSIHCEEKENTLYQKYFQFIKDNLMEILRLSSYNNFILHIFNNHNTELNFNSYYAVIKKIQETQKYSEYYFSFDSKVELPIRKPDLFHIYFQIVRMYPIYEALIDISLGREPKFRERLENVVKNEETLLSIANSGIVDDMMKSRMQQGKVYKWLNNQ